MNVLQQFDSISTNGVSDHKPHVYTVCAMVVHVSKKVVEQAIETTAAVAAVWHYKLT